MIIEILKAVVLGIVQGITEWLPISSTGHLIIVNKFLNLDCSENFLNMFKVVIQFGSIIAVICLYFHKLNPFSPKKNTEAKKQTVILWLKVIVAVIPAAVAGFLFEEVIDGVLSTPIVIAAALIIYGVLFIYFSKFNIKTQVDKVDNISYGKALGIGLFQVLALIPGTSRSGSTILGGILLGASRPAASEFSFFLAIPVMFGASLLKLVSFGLSFTPAEWAVLVTGTVVSFVVSMWAIRFLMDYIRKHDFKAFGYYRVILGVIIIALCLFGVI